MEIDPRAVSESDVYRTLTSIVVPRPIGWISTVNADGVENLAPYSYFTVVSSYPPAVAFSSDPVGDDPCRKDTHANVIETEEFVTNLVTEPLVEQMDRTGDRLDPEVSEFEHANVERTESRKLSPPRVANALASLECELRDVVEVEGSTLFVGSVVHMSIDEAVLTDGEVDARKVDAVGRLGGPYYTALDELDVQRSFTEPD
jgi:flavin reductase (DIM6/NTAB) family NADH-FMN oxidoreductase RutF